MAVAAELIDGPSLPRISGQGGLVWVPDRSPSRRK